MNFKRTYGDNTTSCYRPRAVYGKSRALMTEEEKKWKDKKNAANQKKNRARELAKSNDIPYEYFITITSGISEERKNPNILKKMAIKFLEEQGVRSYFLTVQRNHAVNDFEGDKCINSDDPYSYHIHALTSDYIDLNKWVVQHSCSLRATYQDIVRNIDQAINYIVRDLDNLPTRFHGYKASFKRIKSKLEVQTSKNARNVKKESYSDRYDFETMEKRFMQGKSLSRSEIQRLFNRINENRKSGGALHD